MVENCLEQDHLLLCTKRRVVRLCIVYFRVVRLSRAGHSNGQNNLPFFVAGCGYVR